MRHSSTRAIQGMNCSKTLKYCAMVDTHTQPRSLLDEILLQRRIELWCEGMGRVPDLRRLNLGYARWETQPEALTKQPNDPSFILAIPLSEFNSNPALDLSKDQN